jgi:hypothetical protein
MAKRQNKTKTAKVPTTSSTATKHSSVQEFNPDYTNIIRDLKTIGIMAVSFTGILVVLSFVLN